jgi:hypothetical protein
MSWKRNFTKQESETIAMFAQGSLPGVTTVAELAALLERKEDTVRRRVEIAKALNAVRAGQ